MVSILPSARGPWDLIGSAIGQNLQQTLPGAVQQGYQRQTGLNAIDQLQNDIAGAQGDISKILPAIARAYTLNPSLERSGIAEKLIPLAQRASANKEMPVGGVQEKFPIQKTEKGNKPIPLSQIVPPRENFVTNPQGLQESQLPYGPQEIASIRNWARENGLLPEVEERYVNDALEQNKIEEAKRNYQIQNYQQQQQERNDLIENQSKFADYVRNNAKEFWDNPDERELALKEAEKIFSDPKQKATSYADVLSRVKQKLRPYQAEKAALQIDLNRPLFGRTQKQKDLTAKRTQRMIEMGQKPQLQIMIAKGGNGEVEEAELINPLPESFEKNLDKFGKFVNPLDFVKNIDPDSKEYNDQFQEGVKRSQNQRDHMSDFLSREITSGTYDNPGTNLLLIRYHLMKKGLNWDDAGKIIDNAIEKSGIELDPQQMIDYQKLAYPPLTAEQYSDTILNNLLFPITGKQ